MKIKGFQCSNSLNSRNKTNFYIILPWINVHLPQNKKIEMEINSKKLQLSKITVSKLNKSNMKRINGGSFPCGGQRTKDENDPECDGSRVDC